MGNPFVISTILGIVYGVLTGVVVICSYRVVVFSRRYLYGKKTEISWDSVRFTTETHTQSASVSAGHAGTMYTRPSTYTSYHAHYSFYHYHKRECRKLLRKYCDCVLPLNLETLCLEYIGKEFLYSGPFQFKQTIKKSLYDQHYQSNIIVRYDSKYPFNLNIVEHESILTQIISGFGYVILLVAFLWIFSLLDSPRIVSQNNIMAICMVFILMLFITFMVIICSCIGYKWFDGCFNGWFGRYYLNKNNLLFKLQIVEIEESDNKERDSWKVGSWVEVFSDSKNEWFEGVIMRILDDSEGELLQVQYQCDQVTKRKEVPRENEESIRPLFSNYDDVYVA